MGIRKKLRKFAKNQPSKVRRELEEEFPCVFKMDKKFIKEGEFFLRKNSPGNLYQLKLGHNACFSIENITVLGGGQWSHSVSRSNFNDKDEESYLTKGDFSELLRRSSININEIVLLNREDFKYLLKMKTSIKKS